jgi:hypothetical protein
MAPYSAMAAPHATSVPIMIKKSADWTVCSAAAQGKAQVRVPARLKLWLRIIRFL